MPKSKNLKPAKSANPKWLDTARLFYADSFGALNPRELGLCKDEWSDLDEDEQRFVLAHLHYLDLMAQAGTQRLLVQIRDALEELVEGVAQDREARQFSEEEGEDEEEEGAFDAENDGGDLDSFDDEMLPEGNAPSVASPFLHPVPKDEPVQVVAPRPANPEDDGDDGGGRAA